MVPLTAISPTCVRGKGRGIPLQTYAPLWVIKWLSIDIQLAVGQGRKAYIPALLALITKIVCGSVIC